MYVMTAIIMTVMWLVQRVIAGHETGLCIFLKVHTIARDHEH
jgi:hypothetical protein